MAMVVGISLALIKQRAHIESHFAIPIPILHRTICSENREPQDRKMTGDAKQWQIISVESDALRDRHRRRVSLANYGESEFGLPII